MTASSSELASAPQTVCPSVKQGFGPHSFADGSGQEEYETNLNSQTNRIN